METVIAAVISGVVTLVVCLVNNRAEAEKTRALLDYRLSELEKKQDKHNNLIVFKRRLHACTGNLQHGQNKCCNKHGNCRNNNECIDRAFQELFVSHSVTLSLEFALNFLRGWHCEFFILHNLSPK